MSIRILGFFFRKHTPSPPTEDNIGCSHLDRRENEMNIGQNWSRMTHGFIPLYTGLAVAYLWALSHIKAISYKVHWFHIVRLLVANYFRQCKHSNEKRTFENLCIHANLCILLPLILEEKWYKEWVNIKNVKGTKTRVPGNKTVLKSCRIRTQQLRHTLCNLVSKKISCEKPSN